MKVTNANFAKQNQNFRIACEVMKKKLETYLDANGWAITADKALDLTKHVLIFLIGEIQKEKPTAHRRIAVGCLKEAQSEIIAVLEEYWRSKLMQKGNIDDLLEDDLHKTAYCNNCMKTVSVCVQDFGIGAHEFWGLVGTDKDEKFVCAECGEVLEDL